MALEHVQVTDAVLDELRPDQLAAVVPQAAIGGEDAVAEEGLPLPVEGLAFAVVVELRSQDGLDVLGVTGEDDATAGDAALGRVALGIAEELPPEREVLVLHRRDDAAVHKVEACIVLVVTAGTDTARCRCQ